MTTRADDTTAANSARSLHGSLQRWRIAAYAAGIGLVGLYTVVSIRLGFDNSTPSSVWSPIHGFIYMIYLALTVDLAIKARWKISRTAVLLLLTTLIPFVSFVAERKVTHRVRAGLPL